MAKIMIWKHRQTLDEQQCFTVTSVATKQKERKYLSAKVNAGLLLQSGISGNQNWEITKTA